MSNLISSELSAEHLFEKAKAIASESSEKAFDLLDKGEVKAKAEENYPLICDILIFRARTFRFQGKFFDGMEQCNLAYRSISRYLPTDEKRLAYLYKEYGCIYCDGFFNFHSALDYTLKALSYNVEELKTALYNNIGSQYISLGEYDKAYSYLTKGQRFCLESNDPYTLCFIYENFGNLIRAEKNYPKAITYYQLGLSACEEAYKVTENEQSIVYIQSYLEIGLVKCYLESNQFSEVPALIQKIQKRAKTSNSLSALSNAYLLEGELLFLKKDKAGFEKLFASSLEFCSKNDFYEDKDEWLKMMIQFCEYHGAYKEALICSKQMVINQKDQRSKMRSTNFLKFLEEKELEIFELEKHNREIQMQKEQLEQFAYIVAHDLKTPLSNISNFIGLFSRKNRAKVDEDCQFYLDFALDNSKHLYKMLDDLLRYITIGEAKGDLPSCEVDKVLMHVIDNHTEEINSRKAIIEFLDFVPVKMHSFHLEILLGNLIKNALKFSKKEQSTYVKIDLTETKDEYLFSVSDNGIGIKEEYHKKIFDVFKQLDKLNYQGTGIGLSICKKIINTYGGKIWVSDNEMGGASFHFNIPKDRRVELEQVAV